MKDQRTRRYHNGAKYARRNGFAMVFILYVCSFYYSHVWTHGVYQAFRFVESIWFYRRCRHNSPQKIGKDLSYIIRAQHVLSYHLTQVPWALQCWAAAHFQVRLQVLLKMRLMAPQQLLFSAVHSYFYQIICNTHVCACGVKSVI